MYKVKPSHETLRGYTIFERAPIRTHSPMVSSLELNIENWRRFQGGDWTFDTRFHEGFSSIIFFSMNP